MTKILAVHAHPDDIETPCAATLALLAARGHAIVIATLTAGDCGSTTTDNAETALVRSGRGRGGGGGDRRTAACAEFGDLCVFNDDASRRRMTELIRAAAPDLVITAALADYHPDHEATSVLVRDACFASADPELPHGRCRAASRHSASLFHGSHRRSRS